MSRDAQERIGHIVVMGTGSSLDNYDELIRAIRILHDQNGPDIEPAEYHSVHLRTASENFSASPGICRRSVWRFRCTLQMMKSGGF